MFPILFHFILLYVIQTFPIISIVQIIFVAMLISISQKFEFALNNVADNVIYHVNLLSSTDKI